MARMAEARRVVGFIAGCLELELVWRLGWSLECLVGDGDRGNVVEYFYTLLFESTKLVRRAPHIREEASTQAIRRCVTNVRPASSCGVHVAPAVNIIY